MTAEDDGSEGAMRVIMVVVVLVSISIILWILSALWSIVFYLIGGGIMLFLWAKLDKWDKKNKERGRKRIEDAKSRLGK